ncbi:MAG: hypothetical protein WBB36_15090, partial [Chitinophagales bacterium]
VLKSINIIVTSLTLRLRSGCASGKAEPKSIVKKLIDFKTDSYTGNHKFLFTNIKTVTLREEKTSAMGKFLF